MLNTETRTRKPSYEDVLNAVLDLVGLKAQEELSSLMLEKDEALLTVEWEIGTPANKRQGAARLESLWPDLKLRPLGNARHGYWTLHVPTEVRTEPEPVLNSHQLTSVLASQFTVVSPGDYVRYLTSLGKLAWALVCTRPQYGYLQVQPIGQPDQHNTAVISPAWIVEINTSCRELQSQLLSTSR